LLHTSSSFIGVSFRRIHNKDKERNEELVIQS
jgi:hypothetical protein